MVRKGSKFGHIDWEEVKIAVCERGLTYKEAAIIYNCTSSAISSRAMNYEWPTKHRRKQMARLENGIKGDTHKVVRIGGKSDDDSSVRLRSNEISRKESADESEEASSLVISKALDALDLFTVRPPKDWKEFKLVDDMLRRALGLDKQTSGDQTLIAINLLTNSEDSCQSNDKPIKAADGQVIDTQAIAS
jgi:hypothetical protein